MRILARIAAVCIAASLSSCGLEDMMMDRVVSKDKAEIARQYIEMLRAGDFTQIEARLEPSLKTADTPGLFAQMSDGFPKEAPKSSKIVGYHTATADNVTQYAIAFEYEFSDRWVLAGVTYRGGGEQILGMNVSPLSRSVEEINSFSFAGKTWVHYAFVILAPLLALFTISTAIICYRTPVIPRRWLWIIFSLIGFCPLTLNWTNGAVQWNLIAFNLLGAGFMKGLYAPITIQIAFPLGATLFWIRRRRMRADTPS